MKDVPHLVISVVLCVAARGNSLDDARQLYNRTNYTAAADTLRNARDSDSLRLLGQCYFKLADYKRATETLDRAVALDPHNSDNYLWLGRTYGLRAQTAFALQGPGLATKARTNFEKALELNPQSWGAIEDLFAYYLIAPAFIGGDLNKAAHMADLNAAHDPAQGAFDRARLAEQKKQFDVAEAQFRSAAQLAPDRAVHLAHLAAFLSRRSRYEESDRVFRQAFQVAPNSPTVVFSRARVLIQANRNLSEARDLLTKYPTLELTADDPSKQDAEKLLRKAYGS